MHIPLIGREPFLAAMATMVAIIIWRGGAAERAVGGMLVLSLLIGGTALHTPTRTLILDVATVAVCMVCVLRASAWWTVWAAAFALLGLIGQALKATHLSTLWSFRYSQNLWAALLTVSVLVGALTRQRPPGAPSAR